MTRLTQAALRTHMEALLRVGDSPRRTAFAFAVGVFIGFSPVLGLHTLIALAVAFLFGLNRVAVILGVYSNLPWFIGPYYTLTTAAAAKAFGVALPPSFARQLAGLLARPSLRAAFWTDLGALAAPLAWPFVLGSLAGATALGALAYAVARPSIEAGRRRRSLRRPDALPEVR
ncbi:MAG TPA: DUF2062 domain-containing protein [Vicinamibacterales bacterium]|nr:DUF2062 domain-containing protein [Vicinamibacterales bacterium]